MEALLQRRWPRLDISADVGLGRAAAASAIRGGDDRAMIRRLETFAQRSGPQFVLTWATRSLGRGDASAMAVLVSVLVGVFIYRWALWAGDTAPPGSDGGAWLSFGQELFGREVKADPGTYPPVVPLLLKGIRPFLDPLPAVKVIGLASSVAAGVPMFLLCRVAVNRWLAVLFAVAFVLADYQVEILAFGGYPQLFGTAFLLLSLYYLTKGISTGGRGSLLLSAIMGALAVGSSTRLAYQMVLVPAIYLAVYIYHTRFISRTLVGRVGLWAATLAAISVVFLPFYWEYMRLLDSNITNPHDFNLFRFFLDFQDWRQETRIWLVVALVALPVAWTAVALRWRAPGAPEAVPLIAGPLIGLLTIGEVREFQVLQAGLVLSLAVALGLVWERREVVTRRNARSALALSALLFLAIVAGFGHKRAVAAFDWYRVVDAPVLEALDWLRLEADPGALVVANQAPRGGIYGWWVEGYAGHPTYNAADPKWFIFKQEKVSTAVAARLLSVSVTALDAAEIVDTHKVRYLFLDLETVESDMSSLVAAGFRDVFSNERIMILGYGDGPGD